MEGVAASRAAAADICPLDVSASESRSAAAAAAAATPLAGTNISRALLRSDRGVRATDSERKYAENIIINDTTNFFHKLQSAFS